LILTAYQIEKLTLSIFTLLGESGQFSPSVSTGALLLVEQQSLYGRGRYYTVIALNLYGVDKDSLIHLECQALVLRQLSIQRKSFEIAMTMKVLLAMLLVMKLVTVSFGINLIMVIMILDRNSA
jgi:hypothetical protein